LSSAKPKKRVRIVHVPGWHEGIGQAFVLPDAVFAGKKADRRAFRLHDLPTVHLGEFAVRGTLEEWQGTVAKACQQASSVRLAMASVFAAPNLRAFGLDSFGFNFNGASSGGKTFLLRLATSAAGLHGSGRPATWDGSAAGFEQRALGHRD